VSNEDYIRAVRMWVMSSSDGLVAGALGCSLENLPIITSTHEWIEAARQLHQYFESQMEIEHSRVISRALREIEDRLINGDVIHTKYGATRAAAKMKDLAATAKILFENRKEFQRMAAGQADPAQTHAQALMRIATALSTHRATTAFAKAAEIIDVDDNGDAMSDEMRALARFGVVASS
jgi:transcription elongation GreA/GreB family factor